MEKDNRRKNFLIFIIVLLLFSLGTAVFVKDEEPLNEPDRVMPEEKEAMTAAAAVPATEAASSRHDFFAAFRRERAKRRDREEELYGTILADPGREEAARREAAASLKELYRVSDLEDEVEQVLIGRNYEDALLVLGENASLLIIKGAKLTEKEKEELAAFVRGCAGLDEGALSVFTAN